MEITKFAIAIIFTLLIFAGLGAIELIVEKCGKSFKKSNKNVKRITRKESHFYNFIIE